jgi:hypothetical protein
MKKLVYLLIIMTVIATLLASCAPKKPGESVLVVTGKIGKTNSGSDYVIDQATFDAKSTELTYNDPWMGDGLKYKGILLKDLITMVKPASDVTTVRLIATDGKAFDIALADAKNYNIILARWVDGTPLTAENGGPVKVAYSDDAKATYPDEQWAWWVVKVEFR